MIDRNTRWLEVAEIDYVTATTLVSNLVRTWVSRYGVPYDCGHRPQEPVYRRVVVHEV